MPMQPSLVAAPAFGTDRAMKRFYAGRLKRFSGAARSAASQD
jgi:hypothetical protein